MKDVLTGAGGTQARARCQGPKPVLLALFALGAFLLFGAAARPAPVLQERAARALPPVSIIRAKLEGKDAIVFRPNQIKGAVDGDTVKICNQTDVFSGLFSYDRDNRFGTKKGLRLRPGACATLTIRNSRGNAVRVSIGDELHSLARLLIFVAAAAGAKPTPAPTPAPATGAFPGGTATTLTLTISGKTSTRNLKTGVVTPAATPTITVQSGTTIGGKATLNGTLPVGWTVFVWHPTLTTTLLNSPKGGEFTGVTMPTGFDAFTGVGAYICPPSRPPPNCNPPAGQANIDIDWVP